MNNLMWVVSEYIRLASGSNNLDRLLRDFARIIESAASYGVLGFFDAPPDTPKEKGKYIVGTSPSGAWAGKADNIALWDAENGLWRFTRPVYGMMMVSDGAIYVYLDSGWQKLDIGGSATLDEFRAHINDAVRHITAEERNRWDNKVSKSGDTMTGALNLSGLPTENSHAANKAYVDQEIASESALCVKKAGDTMTGALSLSGLPTENNHAANKSYVDQEIASESALCVKKAGDTMTGELSMTEDSGLRVAFPLRNETEPESWNAMTVWNSSGTGDNASVGILKVGTSNYAHHFSRIGNLAAKTDFRGCTGWLFNCRIGQDGKLYKTTKLSGFVSALLASPAGVITLWRGQTTASDGEEVPPEVLSPYIATINAEPVTLGYLGSMKYVRDGSNGTVQLAATGCSSSAGTYAAFLGSIDCVFGGTHTACIASAYSGVIGTAANQSASVAAGNCAIGEHGVTGNGIIVTGRNTINPVNYTLAGGFSSADIPTTSEEDRARIRSTANRKIELNFGTGTVTATGQFSGGATFTDYAEYFENRESGVIPLGTIVSLDGRFVRRAQSGDDILGVVSATGVMTAGNTPFTWARRYLTGEFGETLYHDIPDPDWQAKIPDPNWQAKVPANTVTPTIPDPAYTGDNPAECPMIDNPDTTPVDNPEPQGWIDNPVPQGTITVPMENPAFDLSQTNIPRSDRPEEWTCVGLLGQVHVRVDATVQVEDWVMPVDGIGTKSGNRTNLKCMEIRQAFDESKGYAVAFCLLK